MTDLQDLGQLAYEAYCASTGGVSAVSGAKLPTWDDQNAEIKMAWIAAARAVMRFCVDEAVG